MSVTDEIRAKLDIVRFIGGYVQLKKSGASYVGLCPFHAEKHGSFYVFPDRQTWRCFGACAEGGDIFTFVRKREGVDFPTALRLLAKQAGVELPSFRAEADYSRLYAAVETAAAFYHDRLRYAKPVFAYITAERGLTVETIREWQLGYAPDQWDGLLLHLRQHGFSDDESFEAGLVNKSGKGKLYDRFRHRMMIPIADAQGRLVGFGARALEKDTEPKYLNSPQSPIFDKSALLFGYAAAKDSVRRTGNLVIVEGYMDALQAHQAGISHVVAQMGTALTDNQVRLASHLAKTFTLALDADNAGIAAMLRGLTTIGEHAKTDRYLLTPALALTLSSRFMIDIRIAVLPEGDDPDDLIRRDHNHFRQLTDYPQTVGDFVIQYGTRELTDDADINARLAIAEQLAPTLMAVETDVLRHDLIQRLALRLRLDGLELLRYLRDKAKSPAQKPVYTPTESRTRFWVERNLIGLMIAKPLRLSDANRALRTVDQPPLTSEDFADSLYRALYEVVEAAALQWQDDPLDYMRQHVDSDLLSSLNELIGLSLQGGANEAARYALQLRRARLAAVNREALAVAAELPDFENNLAALARLALATRNDA